MAERKILIPSYSIPLEKVDQPFAQVIHAIQTSTIVGLRNLDEVEIFVLKHSLNGWDTALHWAVKLFWNTKHKILGGQAHVRAAKPLGVVLACEINLCIQCHALTGYKKAGYPDAAIWFGELWREHLKVELNNLFKLTVNGGGKKARVLHLRHILRTLKEEDNPFDRSIQPCLSHLIDCSLALAKQAGSIFREKYWLPYIRALSAWASELDRNSKGFYRELILRVARKKGKIFLQVCEPVGKGKGLRVLFQKEVVPESVAL
jgi:hypothetical protein